MKHKTPYTNVGEPKFKRFPKKMNASLNFFTEKPENVTNTSAQPAKHTLYAARGCKVWKQRHGREKPKFHNNK
jgi:hypothetical protein